MPAQRGVEPWIKMIVAGQQRSDQERTEARPDFGRSVSEERPLNARRPGSQDETSNGEPDEHRGEGGGGSRRGGAEDHRELPHPKNFVDQSEPAGQEKQNPTKKLQRPGRIRRPLGLG